MTPSQKILARHALGLPNERGQSYRNRYYVVRGTREYQIWMAMCRQGLADRASHRSDRNYLGMDFGLSPGMSFAGMDIRIVDAQKQQRTERDVRGPWVRPRCPNRGGRKGTRRQWKRKNAPHFVMLYREPTDVVVFGRFIIATPQQADALRRATREAR